MKTYAETLARVCLDPDASPADLEALGGDVDRWKTYRQLVRARLGEAVTAAFPRMTQHVGDAAMRGLVRDFLATAPPRTRYVRAIPGEFVALLRAREERSDALTLDLADYELAVLDLTFARDPDERDVVELAMELPVALAPAHRLLALGHAVDLLPTACGEYASGDRRLCVYRSPADHTIVTLVLTPLTHALLTRVSAGEPLARAFREAATACGVELTPGLVGEFADLVADLMERGLVRGSRASRGV